MNPGVLEIIGATIAVLLAAVLAYCVRINTRQSDSDIRIAKLEVQISPLWARVQRQISSDLHHPHPRYQEMDVLLEHLESLTITKEERVRLNQLLLERSTDMHEDITEDQRQKAKLMIEVMKLTLRETSGIADS
jgi:hypothetical protein